MAESFGRVRAVSVSGIINFVDIMHNYTMYMYMDMGLTNQNHNLTSYLLYNTTGKSLKSSRVAQHRS